MSKNFIGGIKPRRDAFLRDLPQERLCPREINLNIPDGYNVSVSTGDIVAVGDTVALPVEAAPNILSGVSGKVTSAESGNVTIISDGEERLSESCKPLTESINDIPNEEITEKLFKMGVPLPKNGKKDPVCLIVGCVEPQDGSCSVHASVLKNAGELIGGAKILMKLIGVKHAVIAVSKSMYDCMNELSCFVGNGKMIKIVPVSDKYPGHFPHIIISSVFKLEITPKRDTSDAGYPFVTAEQCIAVFKALAEGVPYTHTSISISGDYDVLCGNFTVPMGTSVDELIRLASLACEDEIVPEHITLGGAINGRVLTEPHYVTRDDCSLVLTKAPKIKEELHPCISCGRCISVCPMVLFPNRIYSAHIKEDHKKAKKLAADCCIGCGCCSYVCPARLPLTESAEKEKAAIIAAERGENA